MGRGGSRNRLSETETGNKGKRKKKEEEEKIRSVGHLDICHNRPQLSRLFPVLPSLHAV